jgi:hypothetical protein
LGIQHRGLLRPDPPFTSNPTGSRLREFRDFVKAMPGGIEVILDGLQYTDEGNKDQRFPLKAL